MQFFQTSVLNKYLQQLDKETVTASYAKFKIHFLNLKVQAEIRSLKEEQYQGEFLEDLFVKILGYTKPASSSETPFNLTTEYKNVKDSKKADGAILIDGNVKAVIELKGTNTTDLSKIEAQAFGYKNNQPNCTYVITSNFEKLRFYIDNATEHLEFDLFTLSEKQFELLYLCLSFNSIAKGIPKKMKEESVSEEKNITKKLYSDYSLFKRELHQDLVRQNPEIDALLLFKKSQKLLDRFLFLFFAEDRQLLPPNSVRMILNQWRSLQELDEEVPLYNRFKKYFGYLNTGFKGKLYDVFAYNGGLFKPDEVLDIVVIDDELLFRHTFKLAEYDFESEVDVNILGHIFENSLNELDEIAAQLEGGAIEKANTKRKKDGVFYTPKYITKYMVDNTIGKLCEANRPAIPETGVNPALPKKQKEAFLNALKTYRNWLLELTICDPACGSGAFLNQALDFLINEHRYIDELQAKLFGDALVLNDVSKSILEKNLYGVDLNEESVEIAKLSLWLRTAQPNRKLNDLNNNIKCGNSLIDDVAVAGDKAFNWQEAFPTVFEKGGFDVIIGNPPYVNANDIKKNSSQEEYDFLKANFVTAKGTVDLYIYFFEKGLMALNKKGILSYITPNRFLSASYGTALREYIIFNYKLDAVVDYSDKNVFPDASTYPVITTISQKVTIPYEVLTGKFEEESKQLIVSKFPSFKLNLLDDFILGFLLNDKLPITEKVINKSISLNGVGKINATSTAKEADDYSFLINESEGFKLINTGTIDPYVTSWGYDFLTDKGKKIKHPYLPKNSEVISNNRKELYASPKIIISKIGLQCEAFYDKEGVYASINTNCIHSFLDNFTPEYVLCWLNSKLYNYTFECLFDGLRMSGGYLLFSAPNLKNTCIYEASPEQQIPFIENADKMLRLHETLQEQSQKFQRTLERKFSLGTLPKKLQEWYQLSYGDFIKELAKQKVKLTLSQESEWEEYFIEESKKVNAIVAEITQTDRLIDKLVYELYELTEEEIAIVEAQG